MKVFELVEALQNCDQDAEVVLASDSDGNSYHELIDIETDMSVDEDYEVGYNELTPDLIKLGYSDEDLIDGKRCVILLP